MKTIAAKSVEAFQQTNEYNTVLFSWYYKGFELLQWYLGKHPIGMDLESLDLEVVDKKMAADEAAQSATITLEENALELTQVGGDKADAWIYPVQISMFFSLLFFFLLGAQYVFGLFILILEQCYLPGVF